ncbi:MAG: hypothetical protein H0X72_03745 [Acidobacteria bacterium]|jgi:hypothetical protein|nr:hypothetical protein [Acidobacteriota bacterium]
MAQVKTRILNARAVSNLPPVARRLIEENKQRRINSATGGDFRGRLDKTVAYLRWKAGCNTISDAIGYIASELERERLYALYQKLFPKDWEKSSASFKRTGESVYHTEREYEFIELVSDRYFPLCSWLDWTDFRFDHIPIEPINFDLCCGEYDWQDFRPCLQFAVQAFLWRNTDDEDWRDILANFNVEFEALPPIDRATPPFSVLERERDNPKIRRFLHLIEFIYHDTGNPFIDTTCCQPVDLYEWTEENLEKLKNDYQAVSDYFASLESLDASIEKNALSTFKELIGIWNTGRLPTNGRQRNLPFETKDDGAGLLINILADYEERAVEPALTF